jgi:hypothetical protein
MANEQALAQAMLERRSAAAIGNDADLKKRRARIADLPPSPPPRAAIRASPPFPGEISRLAAREPAAPTDLSSHAHKTPDIDARNWSTGNLSVVSRKSSSVTKSLRQEIMAKPGTNRMLSVSDRQHRRRWSGSTGYAQSNMSARFRGITLFID